MPRASSVGWFGWSRTAMVPGRPIVLRKRVTTRHLRATSDQVLVAHDLGHGRCHFRRDAGGERCEALGGRGIGEEPVAKTPDGEMPNGREGRRVVPVEDQAGHLVGLIGNQRLGQEQLQRLIGKHHARRDHFLGGGRGNAGELVAGAQRRRLGHEVLQVAEEVGPLADGLAERHAWLLMVLSPLGRMAPSERRMIVDEGGVADNALTLSPDMQHELCRFANEAVGPGGIEVEGEIHCARQHAPVQRRSAPPLKCESQTLSGALSREGKAWSHGGMRAKAYP